MPSNTETKAPPSADDSWELLANEAARNGPVPAVSVVISLYNYSAYIKGCLDSVSASKTEGLPGGFEVVVVDDASTDQSRVIVAEYLAGHSVPITLVQKRVNSGVADTRNLGLLMARAPLVFILDADNKIRPDCLTAHYRALTASGCALAYGHINRFDHETGRSLGLLSDQAWNEKEMVRHPMIDAMAMFRKEIVLQLGGYSTEYGTVLPSGWEDYDLYLKLAQAGHKGQMIPEVLSDYRIHAGSLLSSFHSHEPEISAYFFRKFRVLACRHPDVAVRFGSARIVAPAAAGLIELPLHQAARPVHFLHRLLGGKLSRSLRKRLVTVFGWLQP